MLDLATRKIVGWSMRDHKRTVLTSAALMMATQRQRPSDGLICHSYRASQYAAEAAPATLPDLAYQLALAATLQWPLNRPDLKYRSDQPSQRANKALKIDEI
ncbi:hypothetical protein GCM10007887_34130 [Methylobacterium haplocladii]|uniref:Integrase catalytic domain-containing protein n=1 Tax=Methylobacterium haplocladii TaxID=1176176 RepID=A0A512IVS7_9HYPH|nr:hypothetical protein MHA02_41880 [Methylobacterium haplocladii]GLS60728.1 hypothetical protein GCM10007887_34130 [Methylobacterium haplocladii]